MPQINTGGGWSGERCVSIFAEAIFLKKLEYAKKILLENPEYIHDKDALELAVMTEDLNIINFLISKGFSVSYEVYYQSLHCSNKSISEKLKVNKKVQRKAEIEYSSYVLNTALLYQNGNSDLMREYCEMGAMLSTPTHINHSYFRYKPFHFACLKSHGVDTLKLLLEYGADPHELSPVGKSPLRLVLEDNGRDRITRDHCTKFLKSKKCQAIPKLSFLESVQSWLGYSISSKYDNLCTNEG